MIINFTRNFEPLHIFKKAIIIIDGCTYGDVLHKKNISLPDGAYLLQIKILPRFYSNTLMINEADNERTIYIESGLNRNLYLKAISIVWACTVLAKVIMNWDFLNIPLVVLSLYLLGSLICYSKNVHGAIKITIR